MHETTFSARTYFLVFAALVGLTVVTVGISFLPLVGAAHIAAGLAIAIVKATLVALIFMHVLTSTRLTWCVIAVVVLWLAVLFLLTFADYATRGMVWDMPGH